MKASLREHGSVTVRPNHGRASWSALALGVCSPLVTNEGRSPKRWLIGEPLPSDKLEGQLLPKHLALPIFASDALSSVAYAPQEMLLILLLGGTAFLAFAPGVAAAVVLLLTVVVLSYRQLVKAYPSGGGDYEVARKNIGEVAGPDRRIRSAGRLRADGRRVGRQRRRQHHLRAAIPQPVPRRDRDRSVCSS